MRIEPELPLIHLKRCQKNVILITYNRESYSFCRYDQIVLWNACLKTHINIRIIYFNDLNA